MFANRSESFILRQIRPRKRNSFFTVFILGCIIITFFFAYQAFGTDPPPEPTLKQINILFRHGEKTVASSYPTDPHKNYNWVEGPGELTNKGKLGLYTLGETLRKNYGHFLGDLFLPNEISILSSYAPRCQMSAMTLLAGLFPPVGRQIWNNELLWQPIPVNPIPRSTDNLIAAKAYCKAFDLEKEKSDAAILGNLTQEEKTLFSYLSMHTGETIDNIEQIETLYFILKIQNENKLNIPDWAKIVFPEPLRKFAALNFESYSRTPILKRLKGGPLLKQWIDNMEHGNKKSYLYAGHDITIVTLMRTIGFELPGFLPDYGSAFILELHHSINGDFVKALYYNNSLTTTPVTLILPGCKFPHCPLEKLSYIVKENVPENWEKECNTDVIQ